MRANTKRHYYTEWRRQFALSVATGPRERGVSLPVVHPIADSASIMLTTPLALGFLQNIPTPFYLPDSDPILSSVTSTPLCFPTAAKCSRAGRRDAIPGGERAPSLGRLETDARPRPPWRHLRRQRSRLAVPRRSRRRRTSWDASTLTCYGLAYVKRRQRRMPSSASATGRSNCSASEVRFEMERIEAAPAAAARSSADGPNAEPSRQRRGAYEVEKDAAR